jgi:hypothetical protein
MYISFISEFANLNAEVTAGCDTLRQLKNFWQHLRFEPMIPQVAELSKSRVIGLRKRRIGRMWICTRE